MSGQQRSPAPKQSRRWVVPVVAGVIVLPVLEILLLILVGNQIGGALWLLFILLVIAVVGALLIRREGGARPGRPCGTCSGRVPPPPTPNWPMPRC